MHTQKCSRLPTAPFLSVTAFRRSVAGGKKRISRSTSCTQMQGYLFCAPEAAREIRKLLKTTAELRIVAA